MALVVTGPEARALCGQLRLPPGWHIEPIVKRTYKYRCEFSLVAFKDSMPVHGLPHIYDVARALPVLIEWIEAQPRPMTVTTDGAGFITSIEEVA